MREISVRDMDYIWDEGRDDVLFFGSVPDLEMLYSTITNCLSILDKSESPREMVLETWITVDYSIRKFLLSGFELDKFCDEEFDLAYSLLPSSFVRLLQIFKDTIEYNKKFPIEDEHPERDIDGSLTASAGFWLYLRDNHRELLDKIVEVQKQYNSDILHLPKDGLFLTNSISLKMPERPIKRMSPAWCEIARKFNNSWFKAAKELNKARNYAAHSVDSKEIGRIFDITGENTIGLIRKKCRSILNSLLAIKVKGN